MEEDIRNLEIVDEGLLRGLVSGHVGLPLPSLYLELGVKIKLKKNKYAIHAYTHGPVTGSGSRAVRLPIG